MATTGKSVLTNVMWRFMEHVGTQLVRLVISIVLARILVPEDYGTVTLIGIFITILSVFVYNGFSGALVQKKDADETDFSSVFYAQMVLCVALYALVFFAAPLVAGLYGRPEMVAMLRVLGITILVAGVQNVQIAYVERSLQFKRFFFASLGGTLGAAVVGIVLALRGFGAWALIAQSLFDIVVDTIILWFTVPWRPKRLFSFARLKELFDYGWKLLASALLDTVFGNLQSLVIGKVYTASDLAFYDRGTSWPRLVTENINASIDSVLFPTMSAEQDDIERLRALTRRAIVTATYAMAPLLMGLAFCGEPLVELILTEKWLPIVPFQVVFCVVYLFFPIHTANLNALKAMGRSDIFLRLEIVKKVVGLALLVASVPFGVFAIALSQLVFSAVSMAVNAWPNKRLLGYGLAEQLKDIAPSILIAVFMGFCVYWFKYVPLNDILILLLQLVVGAALYLGLSAAFRLESFYYVVGLAKEFLGKR